MTAYQEEPREGGAKQDLEILPLSKIRKGVGPGCRGHSQRRAFGFHHLRVVDRVNHSLGFAGHVRLDVGVCFLHVEGHIKSVSGGFRDRSSIVERDASGDPPSRHDYPPRPVGSNLAGVVAARSIRDADEGLFKCDSDNQGDDGCAKLADPLHGEHSGHHTSAPAGGSEPKNSRIASATGQTRYPR